MDNGNQRLFTDDCTNDDASKAVLLQNTINSVTSSIPGLQHTVTDSTPPKITSTLNKVSTCFHGSSLRYLSRIGITYSRFHLFDEFFNQFDS